MAAPASGERRAEIYTYEAQWLIYAMGWSVRVAMPIAPTGGATLRDLHSTNSRATLFCHSCAVLRSRSLVALGPFPFVSPSPPRV
jgi:hypothetical protein